MPIIPTILCGGAGSRLWPVSREHHPKPFIRLHDGQSLLQKAFLRGIALPDVSAIVTVTNRELYFKTQDEYREVNRSNIALHYILEPFGRNTAAAIAMAALSLVRQYDKDTIMLVLAADHLLRDQDAFTVAVHQAATLAEAGYLVTFGVQPTMAETGYGYIQVNLDAPLLTGYAVHRFVEKPSTQKAEEYLNSGDYVWNSGMFCFTVGTVLHYMDRYCSDIVSACQICQEASNDNALLELDATTFAAIPDNSFDYAVMEPASLEADNKLAVIPCNLGWSDIGSWNALGDLVASDMQGNRILGEAIVHDSNNCYIQSNTRMLGAVGVRNLVIVDTPDALLVADKERAQEVKHIYTQLKAQGHETHKLHRTVHRPWGTYTILEEGERFKIKRLVVAPGARLSLQMHLHRSEHWIVVSGMARAVNGEAEVLIGTNESIYIPAGNKHRLENPGSIPLVIIEVQSGEYLGEDDIIRLEDNYGRT